MFTRKSECPKCGFIPSTTNYGIDKWKVEYQEKCYHCDAGWKDEEVDEHLHLKCPTCGYEVASPCNDHPSVKGLSWNINETTKEPPQLVGKGQIAMYDANGKFVGTRPVVPVSAGWNSTPAPCVGCPVSNKKDEVVIP